MEGAERGCRARFESYCMMSDRMMLAASGGSSENTSVPSVVTIQLGFAMVAP